MKYICDTGDEKIDAMLRALLEQCCGRVNSYGEDGDWILLVTDADNFSEIKTDCRALVVLYMNESYTYSPEHRKRLAAFGERYRAAARPVDLAAFCGIVRELQKSMSGEVQKSEPDAILYENRTISYCGRTAVFTAREDDLFRLMYDRRGQVVSRELIAAAVWGSDTSTNITDVYMSYLRRKLTPIFGDGVLTSVRGEGYILKIKLK